jgi:hypothetical protein
MRDLVRALRQTGAPVFVPWPSLAGMVRPRAGNVAAVVGAPGVGKSTFALDWAEMSGRPSLYISLDTELVDHAVRLVARKTGTPIEQILEGHEKDVKDWIQRWQPVVEDLDHPIRFVDERMSARTVGEVVAAETEFWGEPPELTIVDDASGLLEAEESSQEYNRIFLDLKRVAREYDTFVVVLHHLRRKPAQPWRRPCRNCGAGNDEVDAGTLPVHASDILYAGDRKVSILLGLWRPRPDLLRVGILKNRMGPANPNGKMYVTLDADLSRAKIEEDPLRAMAAAMGTPA